MAKLRTANKVLYLDFDGVLHDENVFWHPRRGIYMASPGRELFEWMPILEDLLAPHPDVAIVLSTSWVRERSFSFARSCLSPSLKLRVIGATFHQREMRKDEFVLLPRGLQVVEDVRRRRPTTWFAIDDDDEGWPALCRENLIKTDGSKGLNELDVQQGIATILNRS